MPPRSGAAQTPTEPLYSRIIGGIRDAGFSTAELAAIAGVRERQVQHWVARSHNPQGRNRDRLLELQYIVELLKGVYTSEGIDIWVHGRNRDLRGRRPIDLLLAADFETVIEAVERLNHGAM